MQFIDCPWQFVDGLAYNKAKLEAAVFGGSIFSNRPPVKPSPKDASIKDEDVSLIVRLYLTFQYLMSEDECRQENLTCRKPKQNVHWSMLRAMSKRH